MRTTVTLDDDVARAIQARMREEGTGFKETLNDVLRRGLRNDRTPEPYDVPVFDLGVRPHLDLDKALSLAAALDDEEHVRELELGK